MKRIYLSLLLVLTIFFSGCGSLRKAVQHQLGAVTNAEHSSTSQEQESNEPETPVSSAAETEQQSYTVDYVTFSVDSSWEHSPQDGYEGTFLTADHKAGYQLQGISPLGSYSPEEFFQMLQNHYADSHDILSADDTVSSFVTADHLDAYIGHIDMKARQVLFSVDVLIVPQKNTVVTFAAQCQEGNTLPVDIREITETATFDIGTEDMIGGNTFIIDDGSELQLQENGSFLWYQTAEDTKSPCCMGTYEVFYGQSAIDQVVSLTEYGLTKEELEQTLSSSMNGYVPGGSSVLDHMYGVDEESTCFVCLDTFYAVILHNEKLVDGTETTEMGNDTLYIGYYLPEQNTADMLNANTANYTSWEFAS